jgi:hypothetical protein
MVWELVVNLVVGGTSLLGLYLTLAPILGTVEKQDILNLRTLLGGTRIAAVLVSPLFDYESKLLSETEAEDASCSQSTRCWLLLGLPEFE